MKDFKRKYSTDIFDKLIVLYFTQELSKAKAIMSRNATGFTERLNQPENKKRLTIGQIIWGCVSIASLIIGITGTDDCRIDKRIPVWLIVYGAIGIATAVYPIVEVH